MTGLSPFHELMLTARKRIGMLTGAGASHPLGLPTMDGLLRQDYRQGLPPDEQLVYDIAANWSISVLGILDFELVFTAVDAIANVDKADVLAIPFADHVDNRGFVFQRGGERTPINYHMIKPPASRLLDRLKTGLHEAVGALAPDAAAAVYTPLFDLLLDFSEGTPVLHIFTTNYDRAVEIVFENDLDVRSKHRLRLVRGFKQKSANRGLEFDVEDYDQSPAEGVCDIKLYKLHGSLDWIRRGNRVYESPTHQYLKSNAVIYPLRKHEFASPFDVLFQRFEAALAELDLVVIIGSSLRDQHIRNALITQMRRTSRFKVVVLDLQAAKIVDSFGSEFEESLFPAEAAFGTPEGDDELRDRLMEAATYGAL